MTQTLLDRFFLARPTKPLYHYTSSTALMSILQHSEIWMTHIRHLNDYSEFNHGIGLADDIARKALHTGSPSQKPYLTAVLNFIKMMPNVWSLHPYVASFCEDRDALSLWRGYSPRNDPISFGIDWTDSSFPRFQIVRCCYNDERKQEIIREMLDRCFLEDTSDTEALVAEVGAPFGPNVDEAEKKATTFLMLLFVCAAGFKHSSFSDEREWRLLQPNPGKPIGPLFRPGPTGPVPYFPAPLTKNGDFNIHEIVIGPSPHSEATTIAFKRYIESLNLKRPPSVHIHCGGINASSIPLRLL